MAKKKYDSSEGVWRTIGGRRVFIKTGQSLSDAMKDSGKFKTKMNEKAVKGAREEDLKEQYKDSLNNVSKMEYNGEITKEEYDKAVKNINKTYIGKRNEYLKGEKDYDDYWEKEGKKWEERMDKASRNYDETNYDEEWNAERLDRFEDKFYTRKDGTKEYDPYKGTRFEKKYDSVEDALNDPNHPTRKYIDAKEKTYHVPYQNGGVYTGGKTTEDYYEAKVYKEDDNSTSVLIPRSIHVTKDQLAEWNNGKSNFKAGDMVKAPYGIGNTYDSEKMYDIKLLKDGDYPELEGKIELHMTRQQAEGFEKDYQKLNSINRVKNNRVVENIKTGNKYYEIGNGQWRSEKDGYDYYIDFNSSNIDNPKYRDVASGRIINTNPRADNYWDYEGNGLKSKYKGTIDYLKQTTNMSGAEILELLKRIDEDKK